MKINFLLAAAAVLQGTTALAASESNVLESMGSFTPKAFEGTPCDSFYLVEVTTSGDERYTGSLDEVDTIIIGECHAGRPLVHDCVAFLAQALPQFDPDQYVMLIEQPIKNPTTEFLRVNGFSDFCDQKNRVCHGWDMSDARQLTDQLLLDYVIFLVRGILLQEVSKGGVSNRVMMERIRSEAIREKVFKRLAPFQIYWGKQGLSADWVLEKELQIWREYSFKHGAQLNFRNQISMSFEDLQRTLPGMFEAKDYAAWLKDPKSHWIHPETGEKSGFKKRFDWLAYKRNGDLISTILEKEAAFVLTGLQHMYEGDEAPKEYRVAPFLFKNGARFAYMQMDCERAEEEIEKSASPRVEL